MSRKKEIEHKTRKAFLWIGFVSSLLALFVLYDFWATGIEVKSKVLEKVSLENENEVIRIHTEHAVFFSDALFGEKLKKGDVVWLEMSPLLKEVNTYRLTMQFGERSLLRNLMGLYLPIWVILLFLLGMAFRKDALIFTLFMFSMVFWLDFYLLLK